MPGPPTNADPAVDDHDLAMVEVAEVVEAPVDAGAPRAGRRGRGTRPGWRRPGRRRRRACGRTPSSRAPGWLNAGLREQPDGDALGDLADEEVAQLAADHAVLEAEDQDVDVARRGLDVGEQAREERRRRRSGRPSAVAMLGAKLTVSRRRSPALAEDGLDQRAGLVGADRVHRRGLERTAPLAAPPRQRAACRRRGPRDEHSPAHASSLPFRSCRVGRDLARVPVPVPRLPRPVRTVSPRQPAHAGSTSFVRSRARLDSRSQG